MDAMQGSVAQAATRAANKQADSGFLRGAAQAGNLYEDSMTGSH
jgi:hypothetical protein